MIPPGDAVGGGEAAAVRLQTTGNILKRQNESIEENTVGRIAFRIKSK